MRRTLNWVHRMVREDRAEVTWWVSETIVELRWNHYNGRVTVWVV